MNDHEMESNFIQVIYQHSILLLNIGNKNVNYRYTGICFIMKKIIIKFTVGTLLFVVTKIKIKVYKRMFSSVPTLYIGVYYGRA